MTQHKKGITKDDSYLDYLEIPAIQETMESYRKLIALFRRAEKQENDKVSALEAALWECEPEDISSRMESGTMTAMDQTWLQAKSVINDVKAPRHSMIGQLETRRAANSALELMSSALTFMIPEAEHRTWMEASLRETKQKRNAANERYNTLNDEKSRAKIAFEHLLKTDPNFKLWTRDEQAEAIKKIVRFSSLRHSPLIDLIRKIDTTPKKPGRPKSK